MVTRLYIDFFDEFVPLHLCWAALRAVKLVYKFRFIKIRRKGIIRHSLQCFDSVGSASGMASDALHRFAWRSLDDRRQIQNYCVPENGLYSDCMQY